MNGVIRFLTTGILFTAPAAQADQALEERFAPFIKAHLISSTKPLAVFNQLGDPSGGIANVYYVNSAILKKMNELQYSDFDKVAENEQALQAVHQAAIDVLAEAVYGGDLSAAEFAMDDFAGNDDLFPKMLSRNYHRFPPQPAKPNRDGEPAHTMESKYYR